MNLRKRLDEIERRLPEAAESFVILNKRDPEYPLQLEEAKRNLQSVITIVAVRAEGSLG